MRAFVVYGREPELDALNGQTDLAEAAARSGHGDEARALVSALDPAAEKLQSPALATHPLRLFAGSVSPTAGACVLRGVVAGPTLRARLCSRLLP